MDLRSVIQQLAYVKYEFRYGIAVRLRIPHIEIDRTNLLLRCVVLLMLNRMMIAVKRDAQIQN